MEITRPMEEKLFNKHILVSNGNPCNQVETIVALSNKFGIKVIDGFELTCPEMIKVCQREMGRYIPTPFYEGFPQSVRELTPDQLLFDQLISYAITYGMGDFSESQHSYIEQLMEENVRKTFGEAYIPKEFKIVTEKQANEMLVQIFDDLLKGTRPMNLEDFSFVCECILQGFEPKEIGSKQTCAMLLLQFRDTRFLKGMWLSDTIKIVDEINFSKYNNTKLNKLHFCNADRKLVANVIDYFFEHDRVNTETCYEKKKVWCGLLHHIHYKADTEAKRNFCNAMRSKGNNSVYSRFEERMAEGKYVLAASTLATDKGSGDLLRHLNYIVSRTNSIEELHEITDLIGEENGIVLLQLLLMYNDIDKVYGNRSFAFTKHNMQKIHLETDEEAMKRKSVLSSRQIYELSKAILDMTITHYAGKLGKVYVDRKMYNTALPMQETTSQGGFGVLPKGSRIAIPDGKKIRAFTYWEKVDDIDLSCFGLKRNGERIEFSWRNMYHQQSEAVTYSGDETSGYNGGSEYFDIDLDKFKETYPDVTKIVFCDNVYSSKKFNECFCKAGFMMRDVEDSGEVYEPKTVATSFEINCDSTYAYLFAIDLDTREMVWLNIAREGNTHVAGNASAEFVALEKWFNILETISVASFAKMCATELVNDPAAADIAFTDADANCNCKEIVHSYDIEKVVALMNM